MVYGELINERHSSRTNKIVYKKCATSQRISGRKLSSCYTTSLNISYAIRRRQKNLAADTNCHSTIFGPNTNKRGEQLEIFIAKFKLNIENNCHTPTYESRGAKTCIDITLTTRLVVTVKKIGG